MELEQVQDLLEGIPQAERKSITSLIDLKTDENMKEVITEIRSLRSDMDAKFSSLDMRLKTLYWVIGVCIIPILIYVFKSFM